MSTQTIAEEVGVMKANMRAQLSKEVLDSSAREQSEFAATGVARGSPRLIDAASSGDVYPISVTVHGTSVFTLNAGRATTPPNIAGFDFGFGRSSQQPNVVRSLNAAASSPEQIGFSPNGRDLLVTER